MYEVVDEKDLGRYAIITYADTIFWDSNDLDECLSIFELWDGQKTFRGVYDYQENKYIKGEDIE